jgi:hypothetical protein
LLRRATTRKRILKNLETRVKWIPADQYERLPTDWSVELEKSTFANPAKGDTAETEINDNRFALPQHAALREAAEEAESAARKEEEGANTPDDSSSSDEDDEMKIIGDTKHEDESSDSDSSDTSSSDDNDETKSSSDDVDEVGKITRVIGDTKHGGESSYSDSDTSSSEDDDETNLPRMNLRKQMEDTSNSDDRSDDDSSDESSVKKDGIATNKPSIDTHMDDFDDFLTAVGETNAFETAKQDAPNYDHGRSDKSKGWATQRQRPGQFKKRRVRK